MPHTGANYEKLHQLRIDHAAQRMQVALLKLELAYDRAVKAEARERTTTHYIWRTRGDNKVRAAHAANNGRIFSWDNPPPTGHPGEDYGCRCTAEPYYGYVIFDPPIETVYPELVLLPLLRIGRAAIVLAVSLLNRISRNGKINKAADVTEHAAIRAAQRKISSTEIEAAIKTAKETGNVITKIGKYGTPQIHYTGSNGVTVVVETIGRNAGKIITFWRH